MILPSLLISGGVACFGSQIVRWRNNQKGTCAERLVDKLSRQSEPQMAEWLLNIRIPTRVIVGASMTMVGGFLWWATATGMTPLLLTNKLITLMRNSPYGSTIYLTSYAVGPLVLFPASLLTIAGGLVFGPITGTVLAIIGSNTSSMIAYGIGRRLRSLREQFLARRKYPRLGYQFAGNTEQDEERDEDRTTMLDLKVLRPYLEQMQAHPFSTTAIMHLLFLPCDLVSYGAGALALDWPLFLLGTMVGSLPATLFLAQAGAAIPSGILTGIPHLNPAPLAISGLIFVGSVAFARRLNQRQHSTSDEIDPITQISINQPLLTIEPTTA